MSKKRNLVYHGHKELDEPSNCMWCGKPTAEVSFIVNPGGEPVLRCCCADHYEKALAYVNKDNKVRNVFYVVMALLIVANLIMIGFNMPTKWAYLPLICICLCVVAWPQVFTHYSLYLTFGLVKTRRIIRIIALLVAALGVAVTLDRM